MGLFVAVYDLRGGMEGGGGGGAEGWEEERVREGQVLVCIARCRVGRRSVRRETATNAPNIEIGPKTTTHEATTHHSRAQNQTKSTTTTTHLLQNQQGDNNSDDGANSLSIQPSTIAGRRSSKERSSDRLAADPGDLAERVNDLCHGGLRLACGRVGETEAVGEEGG
jgi:hypothetical protein